MKRKSELWNKSSDDFCLNSLIHNDRIEVDEAKKIWKKDSNTINNSILSLQIEAYENSIKAETDSFNVKKNKVLTKEKFGSNKNQKNTKQIFAVSNSVIQNPFEFSRQQNDRVWNPEMFQFVASQRLYNPNTNYGRQVEDQLKD
uniref:Uncharacterized protein n=1 Tax=Panagrolaimus sp. PS1159 TaxID=55785 RepID=A0AC35FWU3_9BILA